jgi:hypothetical protein
LVESPASAPFGRLTSFVTNTYQYVYFVDNNGQIHELSQSLLSSTAPWVEFNIHEQLKEIPPAAEILSVSGLPLNRDTNATVIYYKDKVGHIIELGRRYAVTASSSSWTYLDLTTERRLTDIINPRGKLLVFTKVVGNCSVLTLHQGLIESLSLGTQAAVYSAYNLVRSMSPLKSQQTEMPVEEDGT